MLIGQQSITVDAFHWFASTLSGRGLWTSWHQQLKHLLHEELMM